MIIEAQKVKDGLFIPMIDQFRNIKQEKIMVEIELIDPNRRELETKHKHGYLKNPVKIDEFSIWEDEQVWIE